MTILALFVVLSAVIGVGAATVLLAFLVPRVRRLEQRGSGPGDAYPAVERMDLLRDEISSLQTEVSRLSERLDFTENLLMKGGGDLESD